MCRVVLVGTPRDEDGATSCGLIRVIGGWCHDHIHINKVKLAHFNSQPVVDGICSRMLKKRQKKTKNKKKTTNLK